MTINREELLKHIEEIEKIATNINLMSKVIYGAIEHEIHTNNNDIVYIEYPYEMMLNDIRELLNAIDCVSIELFRANL